MKKIYIIGLSLAGVLIIAFGVWRMVQQETLADLQKKYLLAQTEEEKSKVIDELIDYYLNLDVPDTLVENLNQEYAKLLAETSIDLTKYGNGTAVDANPYALENDLKDLIKTALVAYVRDENDNFQTLMNQAKTLAKVVDVGTENNYWVPFVEGVAAYGKEQAEAWLKADLAEGLCKKYQGSESRFQDAEGYGALGLRFLQPANDERVRLDIVQRLQWILYHHRSMYELSLALAQKAISQADQIKYLIRSNGFLYLQAETLAGVGENQAALLHYAKVLGNVEEFKQIPGMEWFIVPALLGRGKSFVELGESEKAMEACNEVSKYELRNKDRIGLQILIGNIYFYMSDYEQAEEAYYAAIKLSEAQNDTFHIIRCLNNLGATYERYGEYYSALDYYNQAHYFLNPTSQDVGSRMLILGNIADAAVTMNDSMQFLQTIQEAHNLLKSTNIPLREARLKYNIGSMYKKAQRYDEALKFFQEASTIYHRNGFLRFDLETRIDQADCLIGLSRIDDAKKLLSEMDLKDQETNDIERVIDAIDRLAKIQSQEGNIAKAVESSNQLLQQIDKLSSRFKNEDRLMSYRQRIYDLLKQAVLYEIAFGRRDLAFIKLDYAKAYSLKSQIIAHSANNQGSPVSGRYLDIDAVKAKLHTNSVVIDYMVTEDTLYAFVLDHEGLQYFAKKVKSEELRKIVSMYLDSIKNTSRLFDDYDANRVEMHYTKILQISLKLNQYLFGWPKLRSRLKRTELVYLIPDEFLFEIPFSTLISDSADSRSFMVNHVTFLTLPSTGLLRVDDLAQVRDRLDKQKVLISADEEFPGAREFVVKAKALFPLAQELIMPHDDFTKDDVLAKLDNENCQVYIFIGHGSADPRYPDRSYIELTVKTLESNKTKSIRIYTSDFKRVDLVGTEVVILVGCETASGKLYRGTGISGLHHGIVSLGAKNVVGNLWKVDASRAISQAQDFLFLWAAGWSPSQALQKCQVKAIKELQENAYYKGPNPFFWGSSILLTAGMQ